MSSSSLIASESTVTDNRIGSKLGIVSFLKVLIPIIVLGLIVFIAWMLVPKKEKKKEDPEDPGGLPPDGQYGIAIRDEPRNLIRSLNSMLYSSTSPNLYLYGQFENPVMKSLWNISGGEITIDLENSTVGSILNVYSPDSSTLEVSELTNYPDKVALKLIPVPGEDGTYYVGRGDEYLSKVGNIFAGLTAFRINEFALATKFILIDSADITERIIEDLGTNGNPVGIQYQEGEGFPRKLLEAVRYPVFFNTDSGFDYTNYTNELGEGAGYDFTLLILGKDADTAFEEAFEVDVANLTTYQYWNWNKIDGSITIDLDENGTGYIDGTEKRDNDGQTSMNISTNINSELDDFKLEKVEGNRYVLQRVLQTGSEYIKEILRWGGEIIPMDLTADRIEAIEFYLASPIYFLKPSPNTMIYPMTDGTVRIIADSEVDIINSQLDSAFLGFSMQYATFFNDQQELRGLFLDSGSVVYKEISNQTKLEERIYFTTVGSTVGPKYQMISETGTLIGYEASNFELVTEDKFNYVPLLLDGAVI